jgi:hypothetical protein
MFLCYVCSMCEVLRLLYMLMFLCYVCSMCEVLRPALYVDVCLPFLVPNVMLRFTLSFTNPHDNTQVGDPSSMGFTRVSAGTVIPLHSGPFGSLTVDAAGSIVSLVASESGTSIASKTNRLALLMYQTLVLDDFETFQSE